MLSETYKSDLPIPWDALGAPFAAAEDVLARLDERLRASPAASGWTSRTHFHDACASVWLAGELAHLEDLVLHDAGMDIRAPTHELTRAHAVLRARRLVAGKEPKWALSPAGLMQLRGRPSSPDRRGGSGRVHEDEGPDVDEQDAGGAPERDEAPSDDLSKEFAAIDAVLARSSRLLQKSVLEAKRERDPLVYDQDWDEDARLQEWRSALDATRQRPSLLAAALSLEAWQILDPLQHLPWLGQLLVSAVLRERGKTAAHLLCLNVGLRHVPRERRRSRDRTVRLLAFAEAIEAAAEIGMKEHDRLMLARAQLERKLRGRRSTSQLPKLIELVLARPIVTAALIAQELGITQRGAQNLVAELGLRETTGRGRYRAWGI